MSWNYRIVHHKEKNGEEWYGIHEVYYNADGAACLMSEEPCMPIGETKKELMNDLSMMTEAIIKPVLEYDMEFAEYKPLDRLVKRIKRNGGIKEAPCPYPISDDDGTKDCVNKGHCGCGEGKG